MGITMSIAKWSVYEIGGDFLAAPDKDSAVELLKRMCGFSDAEIDEMGIEVLGEGELAKSIKDEDTGKFVGTIAEARDAAQVSGKPEYICSQNI